MEATTDIQQQALREEKDILLFSLQRGERYNIKRRRFFDTLHNLTTATSLLLGSGTMVRLVLVKSDTQADFNAVMLSFAAATTVLGTFSLVAKYTEKARFHYDLTKRIYALEQRIVKEALTEENLAAWKVERLMLQAEEPPGKRVLNMICHNEVMKAQGYEDNHPDMVVVAWYQRLFAQWVDILPYRIAKRRDVQKKLKQ